MLFIHDRFKQEGSFSVFALRHFKHEEELGEFSTVMQTRNAVSKRNC